VLYFEDDYLEAELAIHIYVDKWPMTDQCRLLAAWKDLQIHSASSGNDG
jgi:hypothetical protein